MSRKNDIAIFKVENGILSFNKEEARDFPAFKEIIERDRGSEGDSQGRKKKKAFQELMYLYLVYNPSSLYRELPDEERKIQAKLHVGLDKDWQEDEVIIQAAEEYVKGLGFTALYNSYVNANRGVYAVGEDLNFFNNRRRNIRTQIESLEEELIRIPRQPEHKEQRDMIIEDIDRLIYKLQNTAESITKLTNGLPSAFDNVKKLGEQLALEEGSGSEIRGGGTLGRREG